jgi:hypothetical protein
LLEVHTKRSSETHFQILFAWRFTLKNIVIDLTTLKHCILEIASGERGQMEVTPNEPTARKIARVKNTIIEVATIENTVLERDVPNFRLFLRVKSDIDLECEGITLILNVLTDIKVRKDLAIPLHKRFMRHFQTRTIARILGRSSWRGRIYWQFIDCHFGLSTSLCTNGLKRHSERKLAELQYHPYGGPEGTKGKATRPHLQ